MRKTERLHAIARQLAICKNCYSINHHSLFKVRNAECLNHRFGLIVTAGLVRQLFWDTQQTFVCCWCYYITYDCMCQHFFKTFSGRYSRYIHLNIHNWEVVTFLQVVPFVVLSCYSQTTIQTYIFNLIIHHSQGFTTIAGLLPFGLVCNLTFNSKICNV